MSGIHDGHRKRVWEQFLREGITDHTPDHKILECLLFYTIPRKDTNELAHSLLNAFDNSLVQVLCASAEDLTKVKGITPYTANLIKMILPIARRYEMENNSVKKRAFTKADAVNYVSRLFIGEKVEVVYLLCMDNKGKILCCPKLSTGDELSVGVSPRTVVETVIKCGATVVMLAHNHPRGFPTPSNDDVTLTADIAAALSKIEVEFLDHIIVGNGESVSLAESKDYGYLFRL